MSHFRLISHFERAGVPPDQFDHFDYVDAFQHLPDLDAQAHPKRRRLAQQFAERCLQKMQGEEGQAEKAERSRNFVERMRVCELIRQEKLEAMRYIEDKYDSKCRQLRYYPKLNSRVATQKGRYWKDRDGFEAIQHEAAINAPNSSILSDSYTYND